MCLLYSLVILKRAGRPKRELSHRGAGAGLPGRLRRGVVPHPGQVSRVHSPNSASGEVSGGIALCGGVPSPAVCDMRYAVLYPDVHWRREAAGRIAAPWGATAGANSSIRSVSRQHSMPAALTRDQCEPPRAKAVEASATETMPSDPFILLNFFSVYFMNSSLVMVPSWSVSMARASKRRLP